MNEDMKMPAEKNAEKIVESAYLYGWVAWRGIEFGWVFLPIRL
jgi:hypothetical protein